MTNEVSPTKQAGGTKTPSWQNGEKTLGETGLSRGAIPHITSLGADLLWLTGKCV